MRAKMHLKCLSDHKWFQWKWIAWENIPLHFCCVMNLFVFLIASVNVYHDALMWSTTSTYYQVHFRCVITSVEENVNSNFHVKSKKRCSTLDRTQLSYQLHEKHKKLFFITCRFVYGLIRMLRSMSS